MHTMHARLQCHAGHWYCVTACMLHICVHATSSEISLKHVHAHRTHMHFKMHAPGQAAGQSFLRLAACGGVIKSQTVLPAMMAAACI
jgi:hypothetical protein